VCRVGRKTLTQSWTRIRIPI